MASTVHTPDAILALLRRGIIPKTDNRDALVELGFTRALPQAVEGYDATLWERSREHDRRASDGSRLFVRERAVLDPTPSVTEDRDVDDVASETTDEARVVGRSL